MNHYLYPDDFIDESFVFSFPTNLAVNVIPLTFKMQQTRSFPPLLKPASSVKQVLPPR